MFGVDPYRPTFNHQSASQASSQLSNQPTSVSSLARAPSLDPWKAKFNTSTGSRTTEAESRSGMAPLSQTKAQFPEAKRDNKLLKKNSATHRSDHRSSRAKSSRGTAWHPFESRRACWAPRHDSCPGARRSWGSPRHGHPAVSTPVAPPRCRRCRHCLRLGPRVDRWGSPPSLDLVYHIDHGIFWIYGIHYVYFNY